MDVAGGCVSYNLLLSGDARKLSKLNNDTEKVKLSPISSVLNVARESISKELKEQFVDKSLMTKAFFDRRLSWCFFH